MKYLFNLIIILAINYSAYSQVYIGGQNKHETKFNIGHFLATTTVEGSYEYFLTDDTSLGGTIYFNGDATDYNGNFGIGPNFRAYFGFAPQSGFFAEVFGLYYTGEHKEGTTVLGQRNNDYSTTALGIGIGNKWVTQSQRFTIEINGGMGRNINPEDFQNSFMFRGALSVGIRF